VNKILHKIFRLIDKISDPPISYPTVPFSLIALRSVLNPKSTGNFFFHLINILKIFSSVIFTPICIALSLFRYRFVSIDLSQLGSICYLEITLRELILKQYNKNKIIICYSKYRVSNPFALSLYKKHAIFISSPIIKILLTPFFINFFSRTTTFKYDPSFYLSSKKSNNCQYYKIYNDFQKKYGSLIAIPNYMKSKGNYCIKKLGIYKPYVVLHARDSGYYGIETQTTRNSNIFSCFKAIDYLIEQGYQVVRVGDKNMVDISVQLNIYDGNLIDYAKSEYKSPFMDCYLFSEASFYIGCSSGVMALALMFDKRSCYINFHEISHSLGLRDDDLTIFKSVRSFKDNSLIGLSGILNRPILCNLNKKWLDKNGYFLEDNTEEEIFQCIKEFIERPPLTQKQIKMKTYITDKHFSWLAHGNFANCIAEKYI